VSRSSGRVRLLLDVHLAHAVADQLRLGGADVESLARWRDGSMRAADDESILLTASSDGRVLVSYDCRTLPERLRRWANERRSHAGVVLIDARTVRPDDIGGLVRALLELVDQRGQTEWSDRVVYLTRA
jgi:predicted nuclease of predicted toxin-antitoxin system